MSVQRKSLVNSKPAKKVAQPAKGKEIGEAKSLSASALSRPNFTAMKKSRGIAVRSAKYKS